MRPRTPASSVGRALAVPLLALSMLLAGWGLAAAGEARPGSGDPQVLGNSSDPVAGEVLGASVRTRDAEELQYHVMKTLFDRYALEQGIGVSKAEIEEYVARTTEGLAKRRLEALAKREELARRLAGGNLTEPERASLDRELQTQTTLIDGLSGADGRADSPEERAAREKIAEAFILQWKVNRALHRQYGGRVIYQQTGPEPLDARRRFLEERQARGDFQILDKQLEPGFWRYFRTDSLHSFYPSGSPEEAAAFARPPWLED